MNVELMNGNSTKIENFIPPNDLKTPVLFLIFNRLDSTKLVFKSIQKARPPKLYIASDGPRYLVEGEKEKVKEVRNFINSNIDWDCKVKTLYRDENLGCKNAVSGGIDWFFENEEMGIILEDDCLPSQSFFWYCEELLNRYRYDQRVAMISGYNKQNKWLKYYNDYFFSSLGGIWGWASWSRAWNHYDGEIRDFWNFDKQNHFENLLGKKLGKKRRDQLYKAIIEYNIDTWDYLWAYARHKQNGLACVPVKSLVKNIGFGEDATHTFGQNFDMVNCHEISFPLKENSFVVADRLYDELFLRKSNIYKIFLKKIFKFLGL